MAGIGEEADEAMGFATVNDATLLSHLDFHRACKTPYEVACMEEANRIAARGHAAARRLLTERPSEFELNVSLLPCDRDSASPHSPTRTSSP